MRSQRYVPLGDRNWLLIDVDVNWLEISPDDRAFLLDIIDRIKEFETTRYVPNSLLPLDATVRE